jgi:hypothetical protein
MADFNQSPSDQTSRLFPSVDLSIGTNALTPTLEINYYKTVFLVVNQSPTFYREYVPVLPAWRRAPKVISS